MSLALVLIQPLQGWLLCGYFQGSRCCGNPSLYDHNPFGVAKHGDALSKQEDFDV